MRRARESLPVRVIRSLHNRDFMDGSVIVPGNAAHPEEADVTLPLSKFPLFLRSRRGIS